MLGLVFVLRSRPLSELNFYVNEVSIANLTSEELLEKIACPRILGNRKLIIKVKKLSVHLHQDNITEECVNLNENNSTQSLVNPPTDTSLSSVNSPVFHPFVTLRQKNPAQGSEIKFSFSESMSWSYFDEEMDNEASINTKQSTYVPSDPRILEDEVNNQQPKTSTPKKSNIGIQIANYDLKRNLSKIGRISTYVPSDPRVCHDDVNNQQPKTSTPKKSNIGIQIANYDLKRNLSKIGRISTYVPSDPRVCHDDVNNRPPKTSTPKRSNIGIQLANYGLKRNLANISRITFSSDDFSLENDETSREEDLE
ncbi:hypothetical protein JTE90_009831 [Oedothorax gibbosus]|uniref:Uncharacterized protein n=1 Tax=Oedothorax gibbosus TaxID=931172 RepID=A0AAV6UC89_9ARAC|nr:hypothetical protein JTE90_009831 [Oedothorax gibbosus]